MPIFRVKSVKIYTGQKKFTRAPPVAPVTNMRYDMYIKELIRQDGNGTTWKKIEERRMGQLRKRKMTNKKRGRRGCWWWGGQLR